VAVLVTLFFPVLVSAVLPWRSLPDELRQQIHAGEEATTQALPFSPPRIQLVRVRSTTADGPMPAVHDQCLHLFGSAGGVTVLYDSDTETTWRIPSSRIDLRHPCEGRCKVASEVRDAIGDRLLDRSRYRVKEAWARDIGPGSGDVVDRDIVLAGIEDQANGGVVTTVWLAQYRNGQPVELASLEDRGRGLTGIPAYAAAPIDGDSSVLECLHQ
jgi:hypothetical protein